MFPESAIPRIGFPAITQGYASNVLALLYQMEHSQWLSAGQLQSRQGQQLKQILKQAWRVVPYYRDSLYLAGYPSRRDKPSDIISRLPVLQRAVLQEQGEGIRAREIPPSHGHTYRIQTSGTTGRAVRLTGTVLTQIFWRACALRDHLWHGRRMEAKLAAIRWQPRGVSMPPDGSRLPNWGPPAAGIFDTGPSAVLNISVPTDEQVDWLVRTDPEYLITYPSQVAALAEAFLEHGARLTRLREIRTVGETVTEEQRSLCRSAWDVPLTDTYSCEEVGYLALQCPHGGGYHVQSENVYLEVLDGGDQACTEGQVGRVVITSLNNFATPLLRYELGDFAEVGAACPCGRGLPVIRRILGRTRNRLRLPGGETRFPYLGDRAERERIAPSIRQFQYVQKSLEEVEYRIVASEPLSAGQEEQLRRFIVGNLGHGFQITITYHQDIPRSASGKYEEFVSEVV